MSKFSIIIPVCGNEKMTRECICSIADNTFDYELIIVDNGSTPAYSGPGKIIRNEKNLGFPVAVNQGIKAATGEVIVILNNDTIVTPFWLDRLNEHLKDFDIVGPVSNNISGPQKIPTEKLTEKSEIYDFARSLYAEKRGAIYPWHRIVFVCVAIRRGVFDKIGLLDEQFSPGNFEDDDFCLRAIEAGFRLGVAEDVFMYHVGSATHKSLNLDYKKLLETNQTKFQVKWPEWKYRQLQRACLENCLPEKSKKKHTLALVMVVKNEEKGLERAILSCRDFVDEIIIAVDNSSTDKTELIALKYCTALKHFDWQDDFSAARNFAHEGVTSDWILFLDGHEFVEKYPKLDEHLALNAEGLLCTIEMENGMQFRNPRIYRKGIQFEGQVHELQKMDKVLPYTEFLIKHDRVGGQDLVASLGRNVQRNDQTFRIFSARLEKNPRDLRALFHLGLYFEGIGQNKRAIKYFNCYLRHSENRSERWYVFFNRALCQLALNRCFRAFWSVSRADDETPDRWEIAKLRGLILFQQRKFAKAIVAFVDSFKINFGDQTYKPWKREDAATWNLIGESFLGLNLYYKAAIAFREAAKKAENKEVKDLFAKRSKLMFKMAYPSKGRFGDVENNRDNISMFDDEKEEKVDGEAGVELPPLSGDLPSYPL